MDFAQYFFVQNQNYIFIQRHILASMLIFLLPKLLFVFFPIKYKTTYITKKIQTILLCMVFIAYLFSKMKFAMVATESLQFFKFLI